MFCSFVLLRQSSITFYTYHIDTILQSWVTSNINNIMEVVIPLGVANGRAKREKLSIIMS